MGIFKKTRLSTTSIAAKEGRSREQGEPRQRAAPVSPVPQSFAQYVRSLGPGVVVVLTWLGAGDIVNSATSGGNYGYALMWVFVLCLIFKYFFVSIIAKYQLCNDRGETILGGLARLNRFFPPFILFSTLVLAHSVVTYLLVGAGSALGHLVGFHSVRLWAPVLCGLAYAITFRPIYRFLERVFFVLAGILTVCFVGLAIWTGPSASGLAHGIFGFGIPPTVGSFDAVYIGLAMIGSVAGGLGNLMYVYFIRAKGWSTPRHRHLQRYDLIFGILILVILDLSVWVVGAEVIYPRGIRVAEITGLAALLGEVLGPVGATLFYLGLFAALFSNIIGTASAYSYLSADAYYRWRDPRYESVGNRIKEDRFYRRVVAVLIFSPLVWVMVGRLEFVALTLLVNASQVVLIPLIVIGVWVITSKEKYIGGTFLNRWWDHLALALMFVFGCLGAYLAFSQLAQKIAQGLG